MFRVSLCALQICIQLGARNKQEDSFHYKNKYKYTFRTQKALTEEKFKCEDGKFHGITMQYFEQIL